MLSQAAPRPVMPPSVHLPMPVLCLLPTLASVLDEWIQRKEKGQAHVEPTVTYSLPLPVSTIKPGVEHWSVKSPCNRQICSGALRRYPARMPVLGPELARQVEPT